MPISVGPVEGVYVYTLIIKDDQGDQLPDRPTDRLFCSDSLDS